MKSDDVTTASGLYIVTVDSDDLVPIDRDKKRPECLRINRDNCKFGRAKRTTRTLGISR